MPKKESVRTRQKNITLSYRAYQEFEEVSAWLEMPPAALMRQILETHHQSPSFANLLRRARKQGSETKEDRQNMD